jgi:hypothetical protein
VLLPGCSAESRHDLVDTIREELDQAEQRRAEQSGDISGQPDARSPIGTDSRNALDYARPAALARLQRFAGRGHATGRRRPAWRSSTMFRGRV